MDVARIRLAVLIPVVVFSAAAIAAIAVGVLLLQVPKAIHSGGIEIPIAPLVALVLVVVITAAGFIADSKTPSPGTTGH
ncbi:MAG: hypothetical protein HW416_2958 [Chloroflexi bacterium]|nr:hypothetical protein [Chloroflexota bacterium]